MAAGAALGVTSSWNLTNTGAVAESLAAHYGIPLASIGLFTTVMFLAQVVLHIPGGRLIDRHGPRRMGSLGLGLIVAGNLAIVAGVPVVAAIAIRFVIGFGMGVCFVAGSSYIRSVGGGSLSQGVYGGLALGAGGLALAVVPRVTAWTGWTGPFSSAIVVALIGLVLTRIAPTGGSTASALPGVVWRLLRDPAVLRFGAVHAATFGISIVLGNWIVVLLMRTGGYDEPTAGAIGSLTLLGGLVGRPLGGLIAGHRPDLARSMVVASMVAGAAATATVTAGRPAWLVAVAALVVGLAAGLPFGPVFTGAPRTHPGAPAAVLGALSTPAVAAIVAATPLVGLTFDAGGTGALGFVLVALWWGATALVVPRSEDLGTGQS